MIATLINALAVLIGGFVGLALRGKLSSRYSEAVHVAAGIVSLVAGAGMALKSEHPLAFSLALLIGGLIGTGLKVQDAIARLGEAIKRLAYRRKVAAPLTGSSSPDGASGSPERAGDTPDSFATGFLDSSILFCAGAMTIIGSFNAGAKGDFDLILMKSALDGCMAVLLAASLGPGVLFSAAVILVYQGGLTAAAGLIEPAMTPTMLSELSGSGGALVIMIGLSLVGAAKIRTADFLPSLVVSALLVLAMPYLPLL
jgi:hypothetical protein